VVSRLAKVVNGEFVDLGPLPKGVRTRTVYRFLRPDGDEEIHVLPLASHPQQVRTYTIEFDPYQDIQSACLHAKHSGDARPLIRLLHGHPELHMLADLLQEAKFKRPRGNSRRKDPLVTFGVDIARQHKQRLYERGWKKGKGGRSIDDFAIGEAITQMVLHGYPEPPDVEKLKERIRTELRRARRK
jgi:hypothetical protein